MTAEEHKAELEKSDYHLDKADMSAAEQGCVTKCVGSKWRDGHGSYRKNGFTTIQGTKAKLSMYNQNFGLKAKQEWMPERMPREVMKGFGKDGTRTPGRPSADRPNIWHIGVGENFEKGYLPFNHDYHHILPMDALLGLSVRELKALMKSGYNLNDGNNLIILPCNPKIAVIYPLPFHASNHPEYIQDVKKAIAKIKIKTDPDSSAHHITQANADSVRDELLKWQKQEFKDLVRYAKDARKKRQAADVNQAMRV